MYRSKLVENSLGDEQEGFQMAGIKIIETRVSDTTNESVIKVGEAKELIPKRFVNVCSSIYTNIPLLPYPKFLDLPLEDSLVKMEQNTLKENTHATQDTETRELWQFLKGKAMTCIYNKFNSKLEFRHDLTSYYKSLEYYLDYVPSNYKQFNDKDGFCSGDIQFSSNFESGNLQFVFGSDNTYYLLLQNDVNTHGYTHWFFFRIKNKRKCRIRLVILNISKCVRLMKNVMGISVFSLQQKSFCKRYWTEGGYNIKHYQNGFRCRSKTPRGHQYYSLEFDYQFKFQSDTVYFSLNIPFTYTKLLDSIENLIRQPRSDNIIFEAKALGKTVSNNIINVLSFTKKGSNSVQFSSLQQSCNQVEGELIVCRQRSFSEAQGLTRSKKQAILFVGRQHPCETNSSYVIQGIVQFLSQGSDAALYLLQHYDIYIIPMVNPDGVVHGHSRVNLNGYDINREWKEPNKNKSNQTYIISNYIRRLKESTTIKYVFDFHSHSKRFNTFGYFCQDSTDLRSFAWFLQYSSPLFNYSSCVFDRNKNKEMEHSFRYFAHNLGIRNSITIETSYYGKAQNGLYRRYTTKHLHEIGVSILKALCEFSNPEDAKVIINNFAKSNLPQCQDLGEQCSDSDPEDGYLDERERVRLILTGRREKQLQNAKGSPKLTTLNRFRPQRNLDQPNKTALNLDRGIGVKTLSNFNNRGSPDIHQAKSSKRLSQSSMLKDDSQQLSAPRRKTIQSYSASKNSPPKIYLWDQDKFNVPKVICYPTSIQPYLERLCSSDVHIPQNCLVKKRRYHSPQKPNLNQSQLSQLIVDSRKRQGSKYHCLTEQQQKRRFRLKRRQHRKLLPYALCLNPCSISTIAPVNISDGAE